MKTKVRIKPIDGVLVREPQGKAIIPKEGIDVILNSHWRRRINDGTMVIVSEPSVKNDIKKENSVKLEEKEFTQNKSANRSK